MLLGRHMQLLRPLRYARDPRIRLVAVTGGAALLAASVSACTAAQQLTTGMKVRAAVVQLGEQPTASVTASVHGSPERTYAFLKQAHGAGVTREDAARLASAELTLAAGSGDEKVPLNSVPRSDALKVAAALNFGGGDVASAKSVRDKLYVRTDLHGLVKQAGGSRRARRTAARIAGLADDLPDSLGSARDALSGKWVEADPEAFDDFAGAAERLARRGAAEERAKRERIAKAAAKAEAHAESSKKKDSKGAEKDGHSDGTDGAAREDRPAAKPRHTRSPEAALRADQARHLERVLHEERVQRDRSRNFRNAADVGAALNGQSQREFVQKVEQLLRRHAKFTDEGDHAGADRVRLTLPGQESAKDLVGALKPLGADIDPGKVPDGDITAYLTIRRGQLTALDLDLGQFTGGTRLPLHLDFSGGGAVSIAAPGGAKELKPQDLLAAVAYGALGTEDF